MPRRALSSARLDEDAWWKWVLFIEGLRVAYTNDTSGALLGSGIGSWIYTSELGAGDREVAGSREVVGGLIVPETLSFGSDLKTTMLQPEPTSFQIQDLDGHLSTLFATKGKASQILAERIAPGVTDLGASVQIIGGATTNPRGRHVGIERIGPAGERRFFPALPFDLVGFDHPVHAGAEAPAGLPRVLVSDEPIDFAGRMVTLYRIYRDPDSPTEEADSYYTWAEAEAAGDRAWWGVMRAGARISANRIWTFDCHGPDAFMRRQLGTRNPVVRTRIGADLELSADESYVAILFGCKGVAGASVERTFDASVFDHQITAVTSRAALAAQLNGWIETALDGSDINVAGPDGSFDGWTDAEGNANPDAGVTSEGRFFVRREAKDLNDDLTYGVMRVAMHSRAWRKLGWEPETQHRNVVTFEDETHVYFEWLDSGAEIPATGVTIPGSDYVLATFTTITANRTPEDIEAYDNDGGPRYWWPVHTSEVFVLDPHGGQVIRMLDEEVTSLYLEGQLTAGVSDAAAIDGTQTERARWFAIEGDVVAVEDDPETEKVELSDKKRITQLLLASWVEGPNYGTVFDGGNVSPALYVERYLDPRSAGFNNPQRTDPWSGKVTGAGELELTPLNHYRYAIDNAPIENAVALVAQILLSTGACAGYDAPLDAGGAIAAGPNTHTPAPPLFEGDYELADLGLGIPYQLVQHPNSFRAAFHTLPGGASGDLCKLRLAYAGPFSALDVLESITRPRQLVWSLAGKQLGVYRLGPVSPEDVDIAITEDDIYGDPLDMTTTHPSQEPASGQVDGVELAYRWKPTDGKTTETWKLSALDSGASRRTGELVEKVVDHGLVPPWYPAGNQLELTGVGEWQQLFRQLWQRDVPEFFAESHFAATLRVSRPKGQDAMPGVSVSVSNPWLVPATGGYGVDGATGRVTRVTHDTSTGAAEVTVMIFAVPSPTHYSPVIRVSGVTGTTVSWYEDALGHGGDAVDGTGLEQPDWASGGGTAQATIYQRRRDSWVAIVTRGVSSVNLAARTLVLDGAVTGYLRDCDHFLVLSGYSTQSAGSWPRAIYGTHADDDGTIDGTTPASEHLA